MWVKNIYGGKYPCLVRNLTHLILPPQTTASFMDWCTFKWAEAWDVTNCIGDISLGHSVAICIGVCSTGKRKSYHYYIRHFLSWRMQRFFCSPLGRKISHAKIFQALPSGLLPQGLIHWLLWFSFKDHLWGRDRLLDKEGTNKKPHPQNIFMMGSVVPKQLVWQNYVTTHRMLNFNASWQTMPYKIGVLPK